MLTKSQATIQPNITTIIHPAVSCAWCNAEQGIPQGDESHGICSRHAAQQYQKLQASRAVYGTCGHVAKSERHTCGAYTCTQQYGF